MLYFLIIQSMKKNKKGSLVVEFALVFPILIFIVFILIDILRIFNAQILLNRMAMQAVNYATRYVSYNKLPSQKEVEAYILNHIIPPIKKDFLEITVSYCESFEIYTIQVKLQYNLKILTPIVSSIIGGYYEIESEASLPYQI